MAYKNIVINDATSIAQSTVQQSQFYKGFSTVNSPTVSKIYDIDLVKQDILNHFNTRKGERVMNPEFGSIIWDLLMEPITEEVRQQITEDVNTICRNDPRVTPTQLDITEYENGYILEITLVMKNTNQSASMKLTFDQSVGLSVQ